jgi:hypothetical protein
MLAAMGARTMPRRSGWVTFAGVYLLIVGVLNAIWGIAALADQDNFREAGLVWSTLNVWGWILIVIGVFEGLVGLLVLSRTIVGNVLGLLVASVAAVLNFLSLGAYPVWSVIALVMNGLIIWALTAHIEEFE